VLYILYIDVIVNKPTVMYHTDFPQSHFAFVSPKYWEHQQGIMNKSSWFFSSNSS